MISNQQIIHAYRVSRCEARQGFVQVVSDPDTQTLSPIRELLYEHGGPVLARRRYIDGMPYLLCFMPGDRRITGSTLISVNDVIRGDIIVVALTEKPFKPREMTLADEKRILDSIVDGILYYSL